MSAQSRAELDGLLERIGSTPFVDHETLKREGTRPVHRLTVQWVGDDGARTLRMESPHASELELVVLAGLRALAAASGGPRGDR